MLPPSCRSRAVSVLYSPFRILRRPFLLLFTLRLVFGLSLTSPTFPLFPCLRVWGGGNPLRFLSRLSTPFVFFSFFFLPHSLPSFASPFSLAFFFLFQRGKKNLKEPESLSLRRLQFNGGDTEKHAYNFHWNSFWDTKAPISSSKGGPGEGLFTSKGGGGGSCSENAGERRKPKERYTEFTLLPIWCR